MPERYPPWIKDFADLAWDANMITYEVDGGHRFRWEAHASTLYPNVGGETVEMVTSSPWTLTVFPRRGTEPLEILKLSVAIHENLDNPEEWIIPQTVPVRWQDRQHHTIPDRPSGSISLDDFLLLVPRIFSELMTPDEAWATVQPHLLPSD
jgi:hypothetical protein